MQRVSIIVIITIMCVQLYLAKRRQKRRIEDSDCESECKKLLLLLIDTRSKSLAINKFHLSQYSDVNFATNQRLKKIKCFTKKM